MLTTPGDLKRFSFGLKKMFFGDFISKEMTKKVRFDMQ